MTASESADDLMDLVRALAGLGDEERERVLEQKFGGRGRKAMSAFKSGKRILKLKGSDLYLVEGKDKLYLLLGHGYCSCEDFYMNNVLRGRKVHCYHQLFLCLSEAAPGRVEEVGIEDFAAGLRRELGLDA